MKLVTPFDYDYFQHGSLRLLKDSCGRLVSIPTGAELEGYLAVDKESGTHAQVRFLKSEDPLLRSAYNSIWKSFLSIGHSDICPQVYGVTEYDGMPCCISELPKGEPVNHFINRNGDVPPEVAVRLILEFAKSLRSHSPSFHRQFAISPESIWISRTKVQPKILLGEISPVRRDDPEAHNVDLCIDLLKYLTGNPAKNNRFQGLVTQLSSGPGTLEFIERLLTCYAEANPAPNYWMGFNDPESLLTRIISAEEAANRACKREESKIIETAKKTFWPALIVATVGIGAFITYCLYTLSKDPDLAPQTTVYQTPQPIHYVSPAPAYQPAPQRPLVVQAPAPVRSRAVAPSAPAAVTYSRPARLTTKPVIEPKITPLIKNILAGTGDLFKEVFQSAESEWLIREAPEKRGDGPFTDEDEKALQLLELKKAAADARDRNQPFEAIKYEVALLKIKPDALDARIRLHDYLSQIQAMAHNQKAISPEEIEILVEASNENSKAKDILNSHYRNDAGNMF
ncbi:MAG: hypothetical protein P1V20_05130 [Verrucomicrobiales bacterium]|nr:hypothetical protein [Verrucomicrobiales bacterium]